MAADLVSCPECRRQLRVPEELVGQQVKCPTCGHVFIANLEAPPPPRPEDESLQRPREASRRTADEDDDRPRRRPRYDDEEDDEDDRPFRRRSRYDDEDDDYDDDRPRRRRRYLKPHRGVGVLVLGILAVVTGLGIILGPIAWVMGNNDLTEIRAGRMDAEGEGMVNAGRICGIIGTILGALWCCMCSLSVLRIR